jgi:hypothetical protein
MGPKPVEYLSLGADDRFQRRRVASRAIATDQGEGVRVTPLVMVCSNAYQMETFALAGWNVSMPESLLSMSRGWLAEQPSFDSR